jgi:predicted enzyme related to lactoylglutathione lyase
MIQRNTQSPLGTRIAAALVLAALAAVSFRCSAGTAAPPSKAAASNPGKFVWHDLTTDDPAAAKKFYGALLGWQYVDTTVLGQPYTVARIGKTPVSGIHVPNPERGKTPAHWLSYMSVADVDASVAKAKTGGGELLAGPVDLTRGRAAVLRDPQGAPFGVVHLTAGDPVDPASPVEGTFFWNEYLTHDLDATVGFYNGLVPFEVTVSKNESGASYAVLKRGGAQSHAGVFRLPDSKKDVPPNWLPYVFVTDPAGLAARVPGLGGRVLLEPHPEVRKGTLAVVADPTGAVVALQKYPY